MNRSTNYGHLNYRSFEDLLTIQRIQNVEVLTDGATMSMVTFQRMFEPHITTPHRVPRDRIPNG